MTSFFPTHSYPKVYWIPRLVPIARRADWTQFFSPTWALRNRDLPLGEKESKRLEMLGTQSWSVRISSTRVECQAKVQSQGVSYFLARIACTDQHLFLLEMMVMFKNNCDYIRNRKSILGVGFSILYPTSVLTKKGLMLKSPNVHRSPPHWQCMLEINRSSMVTMTLGWNGLPSNSWHYLVVLEFFPDWYHYSVPHFRSSFWELHSPSRDSGCHTFCCLS